LDLGKLQVFDLVREVIVLRKLQLHFYKNCKLLRDHIFSCDAFGGNSCLDVNDNVTNIMTTTTVSSNSQVPTATPLYDEPPDLFSRLSSQNSQLSYLATKPSYEQLTWTPTSGPAASAERSRESVILAATTDKEASQDSVASSQLTAYVASQSSIASSASSRDASISAAGYSSVPSPTASIIAIWDTPPETGPVQYEFYAVPPNYNQAIFADACDNDLPSTPSEWAVTDPQLPRVDPVRQAGQVPQRQPPGKLQLSDQTTYEEYEIGTGKLSYGDQPPLLCGSPSFTDNSTLTPNNGACNGVQDVVQVVIVCPYGSPGI
ncbi:MAG: hypothetical protein Q9157_009119, partial [Trypethelium eluteriae]